MKSMIFALTLLVASLSFSIEKKPRKPNSTDSACKEQAGLVALGAAKAIADREISLSFVTFEELNGDLETFCVKLKDVEGYSSKETIYTLKVQLYGFGDGCSFHSIVLDESKKSCQENSKK